MTSLPARLRVAILASMLTCFALSSVTAQDRPKQRKLHPQVQQALNQINQSKWDAAIATVTPLLKKQPKHTGARVARGIALNGKGQYDKAIEDFDVVTENKGRQPDVVADRADAFAHRSFALYQQKDYLEAVNSAYFATLENGQHTKAHYFRAMAYIAREEYDKAITSANRAINSDKKSALAHSIRGYAYGAKGNIGQAIADQDQALKLKPGLAVAHQRRGAAYSAKGDHAKGLEDLNKAISLEPKLADALCDRAFLHGLRGDMNSAMADLNKAIEVQPNQARPHVVKGQAFLQLGQFSDALASLNRAVELNDSLSTAHCFRGYAHQGKGSHAKAISDFSTAIRLNPNYQLAYKGRSQSYLKSGKRVEGRADATKVKELNAPEKQDESYLERFEFASADVSPAKLSSAMAGAKKIDQLIAANYKKHNVRPNPLTNDSQFLRRIYLDISGTIPTLAQTRSFLMSKDKNKRSKLIDKLLNSDGYGSHYFNYWADVLRYTDRLNNNVQGEPYRQWIKASLAENKPWDKLVHEMMTAEGLVWENPATGYMQRDANMPLDNMNNTVRIFLGTRIGCAQCHDHPFDRWTQKEFYQMAAFTFGSTTRTGGHDKRYWNDNPSDRLQGEFDEIEQEEEERRRNYYRFNRLLRVNMQIVNDQPGRKIRLPKDYAYDNAKPNQVIEPKTLFGKPAVAQKGETRRQAFARWLTAKDNPRFALTIANRLWKQAFGVGQIEPVDDMTDSTEAENPELMKFLESEMVRLDFDMKQYLRMIFNSQTYQRQACSEEVHPGEPYHFPGPTLRRMTAEQLWDSILTLAVVDPYEYRELPSEVKTRLVGVDLGKVSAPEVIDAMRGEDHINRNRWRREQKYRYKGMLLARASELPSPVPANHFLRTFGQSSRELIAASSTTGSVPQILFMFNGPISHMMLEKGSTMYNNVMKARSVNSGITACFRTILNRDPDPEELKLAINEVDTNGPAGYGNVIWSLVNTREFLFIQ